MTDIANGLFSSLNRADDSAAVFSSGSWESALPLTNLKQDDIGLTARSTDDALTSTKYDIDYGSSVYHGLCGIIATNCTTSAEIRVRYSNVSDFATTTYDSGWVDFFDEIYPPDSLEWEDDNWWTGKPSESDLEGYSRNKWFIFDAYVFGRYQRVEISDLYNPDTYVEIGRHWSGTVWNFEQNFSYGASISFESNSLVDKSLGGAAFFDRRPANRSYKVDLEYMESNEAYARALELVRKVDVTKQLVFIPDKLDITNGFRRNILGRLRALYPLAHYQIQLYSMAFEIEEII